MKKEYTKPIVEVTTCCDSAKILAASGNEPVNIEGRQGDDWEVD